MKERIRAKNNRTTFVQAGEMQDLRKKLLTIDNITDGNYINKTIFSPLEDAAKKLPKGFVDLLFIDPPYNLNKDFGNNNFRVKSNIDYEKIFENWLISIIHVLKMTPLSMFAAIGKVLR